jgi:hypothetical protein
MSQSTVASSRRSLRVVPLPVPRALPRTFPVRFNATPGLASLLRPARNSYRWVGSGTVVLDEHGIQITAKRLTLLGPRRTEHFIHPSEIREVYREGDTIRIDLNGAARRTFVRLWAEDAARASEIVRLLPTSRTIEIEGAAAERAGPLVFRAREDETHRSLLWFAPLVILAGVLGWLVFVPGSQVPTSRPQKPVGVQAPAVIHPARIPYALSLEARGDLQKFIPRLQGLAVQFSMSLDAVQRGNISREDFQASLEKWLLPQWELLSFELSSVPPTNSVRTDADAQINAVVSSWRLVLSTYAQGLRDNDYREVLKAFDYLRDAEAHEHEAVALLDRLEAGL